MTQSIAQITGKVTDAETGLPIDFVNVWIKNTMVGTTTNENGLFEFERAKVGDTLLISYLGYAQAEFLAEKENAITLEPVCMQLNEITLIPMRNERIDEINSYEKYKKVREFYYNGHYSLARFYEYRQEYEKNPFLKEIAVVVDNALKNAVKFKVYVLEADKNGKPLGPLLSNYYVKETNKGTNEITIDLTEEKLRIPKNGFFVVVDRLNLDEHKFSNKLAADILQPAIGMETADNPKNTWLGYADTWIAPEELKRFAGSNNNIAINIKLTD